MRSKKEKYLLAAEERNMGRSAFFPSYFFFHLSLPRMLANNAALSDLYTHVQYVSIDLAGNFYVLMSRHSEDIHLMLSVGGWVSVRALECIYLTSRKNEHSPKVLIEFSMEMKVAM